MISSYKLEVKICGITSLDDAQAARDAGADYLGFVLYEKSPRAITPGALRHISDKLAGSSRLVGVFVNAAPQTVAQIAGDCALAAAQLCGEEQPRDFANFKTPVWRVLRIKADTVAPDIKGWDAERFVLDSSSVGCYGGTGRTLDWTKAASVAASNKIMLAGGLRPENVAEAVRTVRPFGVDVSSGVEIRPGRKSRRLMRIFVEICRQSANMFLNEK